MKEKREKNTFFLIYHLEINQPIKKSNFNQSRKAQKSEKSESSVWRFYFLVWWKNYETIKQQNLGGAVVRFPIFSARRKTEFSTFFKYIE